MTIPAHYLCDLLQAVLGVRHGEAPGPGLWPAGPPGEAEAEEGGVSARLRALWGAATQRAVLLPTLVRVVSN